MATSVYWNINNKKHLKNVGPIRYCEPFYIVIHQASLLPPLSHAACASMSTTTTTTTRDRGLLWPHGMGPNNDALCCTCLLYLLTVMLI